jgi:hypothetical protein
MSDGNSGKSECQSRLDADSVTTNPITGNGSSSCIAGWFVQCIATGPVGAGSIKNGDAIGIQLIQ